MSLKNDPLTRCYQNEGYLVALCEACEAWVPAKPYHHWISSCVWYMHPHRWFFHSSRWHRELLWRHIKGQGNIVVTSSRGSGLACFLLFPHLLFVLTRPNADIRLSTPKGCTISIIMMARKMNSVTRMARNLTRPSDGTSG